MKIVTFTLLTIVLTSCVGGGSGGGEEADLEIFNIRYVYPENSLNPGDGVQVVNSISVECLNSQGVVTDSSNCPEIATYNTGDGPALTYESPAGNVMEAVLFSNTGIVTIPVFEGFDFIGLSQSDKNTLIDTNVSCEVNYSNKITGLCVQDVNDYIISGEGVCVIRADQTIWCSGSNLWSNSMIQVGFPASPIKVTAGDNHFCALMSDGSVECVGKNNYGQLGYGVAEDVSDYYTDSVTASVFGVGNKDVIADKNGTCVITSSDTVKCVGQNTSGRFGNNSSDDTVSVVTANFSNNVSKFELAPSHSCAILVNGDIECVGQNGYGQLGTGDTTNSMIPVPSGEFSSGAKSIYTIQGRTCAVTSIDNVECFGIGPVGLLGTGTTQVVNTTAVDPGFSSSVKEIHLFPEGICATLNDNTLECSGRDYGIFGDGDPGETALSPVPVYTGVNFLSFKISKNVSTGCGINEDSVFICVGDNSLNQLGKGNGFSTSFSSFTNPMRDDI